MSARDREKAKSESAGRLWRPLRLAVFRNLLIANLVSDIGTFMQNVGAAWLMVSFGVGPGYVALTQTAAALPFFVFAPLAGAIGDVVDRRKLVLFTEAWMILTALALAVLTIHGTISPWLLLGLTFAVSAGDAFEAPSWRAILPELVRKDDLASASALNGIEFNFARAVGPALAGIVVAAAGVATAFVLNVVSFLGVFGVIAAWKRPVRKPSSPPESLSGALVAGFRYVRFSPEIKAVMARQGASMFFASALLALLPSVAHGVSKSAAGYGSLLGVFGVGAVVGAFLLQPLRARWSVETVVSGGIAVVGFAMVAMGSVHGILVLASLVLVAGAAWICFVSLIGALMQTLAPDWVRARVLAVFLLVFQGSVAAGSAIWGGVAQRVGVQTTFHWAGTGAIASIGLVFLFRLPDAALDLSPGIHWRVPTIAGGILTKNDPRPVLVTVEYVIPGERQAEFQMLMDQYGLTRRRDGASRWEIFRDVETNDRYLEVFLVSSWAEHLRQHDRQTIADQELEGKIRQCAASEPTVRHLLYAEGGVFSRKS
jgi:MFS family permease